MKQFPKDISSAGLHILAMALMLSDHLWATVVPGNGWMTWLGRLAYPIFAFLLVEGYSHTRNFRCYRKRLLLCALLAEVPFNLMYGASWFYPFQQNVLWTLLLGLCAMDAMVKEKTRPILAALKALGYVLLATLGMTDYMGCGVLMILVFFLFRGRKWYHLLGQLTGLYYINWHLMGGLTVTLGSWEIPQQGMAVFSLLPIWLYRGRQGHHSKAFQYFCYGFYPVHMLILGLLSL